MAAESEFQQMWSMFLQTCRATVKKGKDEKGADTEFIMVEDTLAFDAVAYILRQFNESTLEGSANTEQAAKIMQDASRGYFLLLYFKNYDTKLMDKEPLLVSGNNIIRLLCSKVIGTGYRNYKVNMKYAGVAPNQTIMGVPMQANR
jgi:hypothetical protein